MSDIYIPTLHTIARNNSFTGSYGDFRFKIVPQLVMATPKEVDFEQSAIFVQFWHGPYCYEKSEIEGENTFALSEEGYSSLKAWLEENI